MSRAQTVGRDIVVPPFGVGTPFRDCYLGIETERLAAVIAIRLVRRGARLVNVFDRTGRILGIYERAE